MKKVRGLLVAPFLAVGFVPMSHGAVVWDFNFTDMGVGFNDPLEGADRRGALESAADYVSSFLTSYNAVLEIDVDGSTSGGGTLAAAGSNFNGATFAPGFGVQGDIMSEILTGTDAAPASDGSVTWNFTDFQWEYGSDFQAGEFDFFSTAVHELTHALGFASEIQENGNDGFSTTPGNPGAWAPFDQFLVDSAGQSIIDQVNFTLDQMIWDQSRLSFDGTGVPGCGSGLQFNGANAVAANGGNNLEIYSPDPWEAGSSGSHLDDQCYTTPGSVSTFMMEAATVDGLGVREYSAIEIGLLRDIGYESFGLAATVSVPGSLLLVLSGFGWVRARKRG